MTGIPQTLGLTAADASPAFGRATSSPVRGMGSHHSARMGKDEWLTPPEIIVALGSWQAFDLDPCAPIKRPWPTAQRHYTIEDDGLALAWNGRVWCNPPYGAETGQWLERCAEHRNATALIFARTETKDWIEHVWKRAHAILFLWGRLYFYHVDGRRAHANSGAPSALIAYDETNALALEASGLPGRVVRLVNTTVRQREESAE